ncbi:glycosyltransferase [Phyllobacterium sp. YR531]|uniref:glycosyltransferase n=1 Tax=Phyllobacterium sp. YR531 TaxID=1144343 RepID=UPI00026F990C|nr:glycosyltransferase [Phyllobacterium sp. YR531]EJN00546.1 glycosyltransferase [Phyllobacterium sp. YR531]
MRFLFIIADLGPNGVTYSRLRYAGELARRGHSVTILALVNGETRPIPDGVEFEILDRSTNRLSGIIQQIKSALRLRQWFKRATRIQPFDFVSSSLTPADRVVARAGLINVHHWIHIATSELIASVANPKKRQRRRQLLRAIYHGKPVIGVSRGVIDDLAKLNATPSRATLVHNGYDVEHIKALAAQKPADLPAEPYYIHVGRFAAAKRHDVLFEGLRRSGSTRKLLLLTDKPDEAIDLARQHALDGRVLALDFRDNPFAYMAGAEALLLSSDLEGFPNVLVESFISGTPVISTDCPYGPSEILTGPYAEWLVPTGNPDALSERIRAFESSPYEIEPWLYQRFTLAGSMDQLEELARLPEKPSLGKFCALL